MGQASDGSTLNNPDNIGNYVTWVQLELKISKWIYLTYQKIWSKIQ